MYLQNVWVSLHDSNLFQEIGAIDPESFHFLPRINRLHYIECR